MNYTRMMTDSKHTVQLSEWFSGLGMAWCSSLTCIVKTVSIASIQQSDSRPPTLFFFFFFLTVKLVNNLVASVCICFFRRLVSLHFLGVLLDLWAGLCGAPKTMTMVTMMTTKVCRCFISSKVVCQGCRNAMCRWVTLNTARHLYTVFAATPMTPQGGRHQKRTKGDEFFPLDSWLLSEGIIWTVSAKEITGWNNIIYIYPS